MAKTPPTDPVDNTAASDGPVSVAGTSPPQDAGAAVTRPPAKWAEVYYPSSDRGRLHADAWKHAAADMRHGWSAYAMRTGQAPQLTAADYLSACAAIEAADNRPHPAADYRDRS